MRISIIMPVYNQEKFLAETIDCVLKQSFKDFELLLLDDGSTDRSAEIIKTYAQKESRIRPFFQKNAGRSFSANFLVGKAQYDWCFFLDADDLLFPETLEKKYTFHLDNPELDGSSSHCIYINEEGKPIGVQQYKFLKNVEDCRNSRKNNEMVLCSFGGLMVTKSSYLKTGGLRNIWPGDDFDFINRFIEMGNILVIQQESLYKYRRHSASDTMNAPYKIYDANSYISYCATLRRSGQKEISFEEFKMLQSKDPWWMKINRFRLNYSQIFFRDANYARGERKILSFISLSLAGLIFAPDYALKLLHNLYSKIKSTFIQKST